MTGDFGDRVIYVLARIGIGALRLLPIDTGGSLGALVAGLVGPHLRQHRRALANIALAFPAMIDAEREALARRMWRHMGRAFIETINIDRILRDPGRIEHVDEAHWRDVVSGKTPVIGITAHIGNWELVSVPMTRVGRNVAGVYRPLKNPYLDRWVRRQRALLYPGGLLAKGDDDETGGGPRTARRIIDHARRGGVVGFVADHYDRRGVPVSFLGRHTLATPAPAMIARHVSARMLMPRCLRTGEESRFRLDVREIVRPGSTSKSAEDAVVTALVFAEFERWIRENPEQWMWWNTRWMNAEGKNPEATRASPQA